jgi:hypothetical protein
MFGIRDLRVYDAQHPSTGLRVDVRPFGLKGDNAIRRYTVKEIEVFTMKGAHYQTIHELQTSVAHKTKRFWFELATLQIRTPQLDSVIISKFPETFTEFADQQFELLWRGSRDGYTPDDFHRRCDGHGGTVTLILDVNGSIFGGFTSLPWESHVDDAEDGSPYYKTDSSGNSFLFTLKNVWDMLPRNFMPVEEMALRLFAAPGMVQHFNAVSLLRAVQWTSALRSRLTLMTDAPFRACSCKVTNAQ